MVGGCHVRESIEHVANLAHHTGVNDRIDDVSIVAGEPIVSTKSDPIAWRRRNVVLLEQQTPTNPPVMLVHYTASRYSIEYSVECCDIGARANRIRLLNGKQYDD
jgi:hypothetical protein